MRTLVAFAAVLVAATPPVIAEPMNAALVGAEHNGRAALRYEATGSGFAYLHPIVVENSAARFVVSPNPAQ